MTIRFMLKHGAELQEKGFGKIIHFFDFNFIILFFHLQKAYRMFSSCLLKQNAMSCTLMLETKMQSFCSVLD